MLEGEEIKREVLIIGGVNFSQYTINTGKVASENHLNGQKV